MPKSKARRREQENESKGGKENNRKPEKPKEAQITEMFVEPQVLPRDRVAKVKPFWESVAAERKASEREARSQQEAEAIQQKWAAAVERQRAEETRLRRELADGREENQRLRLLTEHDDYWRLHMEQLQAEHRLTQPAIQGSESNQDLPRRPSNADPQGQQAESQAASSAYSASACSDAAQHLAAITDTMLGHPQQSSQQRAEPSQDACSHAVGGAQAAPSADRAPACVTPEPAEQGLLLRSTPPSPSPEPAQEAPAATLGLQDMLSLLLPSESYTPGHIVPSQQLSRSSNTSGAVQTGSAAAGSSQYDAEQQQGVRAAPNLQLNRHKPRPKPRARQAEACTGPPSSCMPAAVLGDDLCPEDECVICLAAQRCVVLAPCGHMPYCIKCAEQLCGPKGAHATSKGQVCPLCREAVLATISKTYY